MNTYVLHVYLFYKCVETWYYHPVQKQGTLCNICIKSVYYVSGSVERKFCDIAGVVMANWLLTLNVQSLTAFVVPSGCIEYDIIMTNVHSVE